MTTLPHPSPASPARQRRGPRLAPYALHAVLVLFFLFPLLFMFVSAFKGDELQLLKDMGGLRAFVPAADSSLQNFRDVFERTPFWQALGNSVLTVGLTVVLGILVNSMLAYALARFRFRGRDWMLAGVVALIVIPFEAIAVPLLLLVNQLPWWTPKADGWALGWLDSPTRCR